MDSEQRLKEVRQHLQEHFVIDEMYLFGSRARGTYQTDSDYDIAIVSRDFENMNFSERQRRVRPLIRDVLDDVSLDVVCYTPDEYEAGKQAFLPRHIEDEGIAIT